MLGLYVHIPFCNKKCYYCDFTSYVLSEHLMYDYVCSVLKELEMYKNEKFDTIFIGGGTPSYLDNKSLEKLLSGISKITNHCKVLEFTIECNPGTLSYDKLKIMNSYGVNRLSIGLQSVNQETLRFIGRNHSFEDFERSFNCAVRAGFRNISVDIIFGLMCENFDNYKNTIDTIGNYNLTHISAYNLILENNTRFYKMYERGMLSELDEDLQFKMYTFTKERFEELGFEQYEISNYAKKGKKCLHNLIYWNFDSYVGVGVSSHSFYNGFRFENTKDINKYISMINSEKHKYENVYKNTENDNIQDYIMLGFRKNEGIDLLDFKKKFDEDFLEKFENEIKIHIDNELINFKDSRIFLTEKGIILMNRVIKDFIFK